MFEHIHKLIFRLILSTLGILILNSVIASGAAVAEPVFIKSGARIGQGYAMSIERTGCFIATVAHNLEAGREEHLVFGRDGEAFPARLISIDPEKDLAILDIGIDGASMKYTYTFPSFCRNEASQFFRDLAISAQGEIFTWIDTVSSPAGGLNRTMIGSRISKTDNHYLVYLSDEKDYQPSKGDSGSPVFARTIEVDSQLAYTDGDARSAEMHRRLFRDHPDTVQPYDRGFQGFFIGLTSSTNQGKLSVIPAHEVLTFLLDAIMPVENADQDIKIKSQFGSIVAQFRGISRQSRSHNQGMRVHFDLREIDLYAYTWIFDLGPRDHILKKVSVLYKDDPSFIDKIELDQLSGAIKPLSIFSSNYEFDQVDTLSNLSNATQPEVMKQNGCKVPQADKPKFGTGKLHSIAKSLAVEGDGYLFDCDLYDLTVARTVAITVFGKLDSIDHVQLEYYE